MKLNQLKKNLRATLLALTGMAAIVVLADQPKDNNGKQTVDQPLGDACSQTVPFTVQSGGSGSGCPGAWTGYAKMTNAAGTFWITPPTNATGGTFTDASGFAAPYTSVAYVKRNDLTAWCDTNSVTFPVTSAKTYQLTVYVKSPLPPPTNGQPMNLQVTWQ